MSSVTFIQQETPSPIGALTQRPLRKLTRSRNRMAFMLAESMIAAAILALVIVGTSQTLLIANRFAAAGRVLTAARAVVQRNIDTALTTSFTQASTPAILATTPATGTVYDDDGGGDNTVQISVQDNNTAVVASGVLTRTVLSYSNTDNAVILQVTFSLTYSYRGRTETLSMTTFRARDD